MLGCFQSWVIQTGNLNYSEYITICFQCSQYNRGVKTSVFLRLYFYVILYGCGLYKYL